MAPSKIQLSMAVDEKPRSGTQFTKHRHDSNQCSSVNVMHDNFQHEIRVNELVLGKLGDVYIKTNDMVNPSLC